MKKPFYITTTLPYVNADPHLGHAMEFIRADIIARWKKINGYDVFFNTGTDEHGLKIYQKAFEVKEDTKAFVDRYVETFKSLKGTLGLSDDIHFIRTTDPHHISAAQAFWKLCDKNGYIYKKLYKTRYCSGCELEKTDIEIENGKCFIHQNIDLVIIEEENYFFKFSAFQEKLLSFYEKNPDFVVPDFRFNEIKSFVSRGLEDFSISRLASKMPWGVPVPGDDTHVMYVWFDALVNYISTLGWPEDTETFEKFWKNGTPVQYCGKDNLRQQTAMWQAMLMAAGLSQTHQVVIDGFVTGEGGIKMSKSIGNVVNPVDIVNEYGTDALRYYMARELSPFEDSPFTAERFKEGYNAALANGLGNLVSRVMKMSTTYGVKQSGTPRAIPAEYTKALESFKINEACDSIWTIIQFADKRIHETEPFKLVKKGPEGEVEAKKIVGEILDDLALIAVLLQPIMPETAGKIGVALRDNVMPTSLFMRK